MAQRNATTFAELRFRALTIADVRRHAREPLLVFMLGGFNEPYVTLEPGSYDEGDVRPSLLYIPSLQMHLDGFDSSRHPLVYLPARSTDYYHHGGRQRRWENDAVSICKGKYVANNCNNNWWYVAVNPRETLDVFRHFRRVRRSAADRQARDGGGESRAVGDHGEKRGKSRRHSIGGADSEERRPGDASGSGRRTRSSQDTTRPYSK